MSPLYSIAVVNPFWEVQVDDGRWREVDMIFDTEDPDGSHGHILYYVDDDPAPTTHSAGDMITARPPIHPSWKPDTI